MRIVEPDRIHVLASLVDAKGSVVDLSKRADLRDTLRRLKLAMTSAGAVLQPLEPAGAKLLGGWIKLRMPRDASQLVPLREELRAQIVVLLRVDGKQLRLRSVSLFTGLELGVGSLAITLAKPTPAAAAMACRRVDKCWHAAALAMRQGNHLTARPWLSQGCRLGHRLSCHELGRMLTLGLGGAKDRVGARAAYRKACRAKVAAACANLGAYWEKGWGGAKSIARARQLYQQACRDKSERGCVRLARLNEQGIGVPQDLPRARQMYLRSCAKGDLEGCARGADLLIKGAGGPKDAARARQLFEKACAGRVARACLNLAALASQSGGGATQAARVLAMTRRACELGHAEGCSRWALLTLIKGGDKGQTAKLAKRGCEGASALGCMLLGELYFKKVGGRGDLTPARRLFEQACALGYKKGCTRLEVLKKTLKQP
ncbi:MAG: tetratricopeptide repeat protein [bacterium]